MSISTNSINYGDDFTPAENGEVNGDTISLDNDGQFDGNNESITDQQQLKEFRENFAKLEMELKMAKLELENKVLEQKLKHQEMMVEQKTLKEKMAKIEQKKEKNATNDQLSKILQKISELEKQQKEQSKGCCSVFAKHPILLDNNSSDIFYYEISVQNKKCWMSFGFAVKQQNKLDGTIRTRKGTYAIDSDGKIWINGKEKGTNFKYSYCTGDTVGIGANSATRQLVFTKNGEILDFSDFFIAPSVGDDSFYPFVSLRNSAGDKIEANFGPNFTFDLDAL
ncbi:hypothetical protein niasHT_001423 [Heterodera trifolii]|uniref:B30.2/SPRY domain-containing protein n=1 Tax=Heterodera trifolii TaxID=157864 RepID=A0ABD2LRG1_9BILA